MDFNFEEMVALYKSSPEEFERVRAELLNAEISKAPIKHRNMLRMIQLECDTIHETHDPLFAAIRINELMLEKTFDLQDSMVDLGTACQEFNDTIDKSGL